MAQQPRTYLGCRVIEVKDGDTIKVEVDLGFEVTVSPTIRFARIQAPEKDGPTREEGLKVASYVAEMLGTQYVDLIVYKKEKYGRWLAEVILNEKNVSDHLLKIGYARPYKV